MVVQKCGLPPETVARMQHEAWARADDTDAVIAHAYQHWTGPNSPCACLSGFADDARTAITQAPDYFVWWYTAKSIGLGLLGAAFAFMLGRASAQRKR